MDEKIELISNQLSKRIFGKKINELDSPTQLTLIRMVIDMVNNNLSIEDIEDL